MSLPKVLQIQPIQTRIFHAGESLAKFILEQLPADLVQEKMVLAVTSKIVSLAENRLVPKAGVEKQTLVKRESDHFLGEIAHGCSLTIKEGLFIPSAGIDESNSESDDYILYPQHPFKSAERLWKELRAAWKLKNLGILLTDSHTTPLRKGVTGISLAHWGFSGVKNKIDTPDLFGRKLKMTQMNLADGLAAATTLMMGEGDECTPLARVMGADVEFKERLDPMEVRMPLKEDLYYPFFRHLI